MATTTAVVNGVHPPAQGPLDEVAEFEKILKLRDDIFSGNHPRLTVPAHVLRNLSPASTQVSSHTPVPVPVQQPVLQVPGLSMTQMQDPSQGKKSPLPLSAPAPTPASAPTYSQQPATTASGINPILLTKSIEVLRAETNLLRNRLEKQLRDQFEQKRADFRKRPAPAEAKPDFDISTVLAQALDLVKPVSLSKDSDKEDENESFDENSLYSSRAPDSTPERPDPSASSQEGELHEDLEADGAKETTVREANSFHPDPPPSMRATLPQLSVSRPIPSIPSAKPSNNTRPTTMHVDDEDEEGEYSPPEAVDQPPAQNGNSSQMIPDPRSRHLRKYSDLDQNGKRPASPSDNMRIVRNHITSPLAPQPSRVSPLTLTKDSLVSQDRRYQDHRQRGRANSPSQSPETVGQRNKKRKMGRKEEKRQKKVKREEISPPPFHDIQPLGQNKVPQSEQQPIIIDDLPLPPPPPPPPPPLPLQQRDVRYIEEPPTLAPISVPQQAIRYIEEPPHGHEIRYMPAPRYMEAPPRPLSRQPEMIPMGEPRVLSRAAMRPREDQDLRKVASMHNMRVEQPREYVEASTPSRQRAMSYMRVESPIRELPRGYATESERAMPEVRVVRTPAPEYQNMYSPAQGEVRYIQEPMLPPPPPRERIVVDQYGRRFREIVAEPPPPMPRATSYAPREMPRYADAYTSSRAGSVMIEERPSVRYEQDMPPPPAQMMRQVGEAPLKTPMIGARDMYEPISGGRSGGGPLYDSQPNSRPGTAQMYERPRQPVYSDDAGDYRAPVRMSSVRPPSQYEDVMQVLPRAGSVRPGAGAGAREGSMYLDERGAARREYIAVDQPRYRVVEPEVQMQMQMQPPPLPLSGQDRYVDAHGREMVATAQREGEVRYVQRY